MGIGLHSSSSNPSADADADADAGTGTNAALVSVLMPVGRVDQYVAPAIDSVLAQSGVELELILMGPQESDPAFAQLQALVNSKFSNDARCKVIPRHQLGISHALNEGLANTRGEYIARMDADDLCEPTRLQQQIILAQRHNNHCLVGTQVTIFSNEHVVQQGNHDYETWLNQHSTPESIRHACFVESPLPHPTWLAHKSIWKTLGAYQHGDFPEDYDYLLRAWLKGIPMLKPDGVLLHWREHESRLTRTDTRYRREAFTHLKACALANPNSGTRLHQGRAVWIAGTGRNARHWHDALEQNNVEVAGFVDFDGPNAKQQKRDKPIIGYNKLATTLNDDLLITAFTQSRAREQLKTWCQAHGFALGDNVILGG